MSTPPPTQPPPWFPRIVRKTTKTIRVESGNSTTTWIIQHEKPQIPTTSRSAAVPEVKMSSSPIKQESKPSVPHTTPTGYRKQVLFGAPYGSNRSEPSRVLPASSGAVRASRPAPYVHHKQLVTPPVKRETKVFSNSEDKPTGELAKIAPTGLSPSTSSATPGGSFPKVLYVHSLPISVLSAGATSASKPRALHLVKPNESAPIKFRVTGPPVTSTAVSTSSSPPPFVALKREPEVQRQLPRRPLPQGPPPPYRKGPLPKLAQRKEEQKVVARVLTKEEEEKEKEKTKLQKKLEQLEKKLKREKNALAERHIKITKMKLDVVKIDAEIDEQDMKLKMLENGGMVEGSG